MRPMPPSHLPLLAAWLLTVLPALAAAKIVFLNGTEVFRVGNGTTPAPIKWFQEFQPRNISNHSGAKTEAVIRKSDAEEQPEEQRLEAPLATRDPAMLSSLRGIWSDLSPILTVLSTILGIFLMFVIVESPLSPLPVPPLPYSPVGPYPPTNMYPFGIPPHRSHYDVGGPQSHTSYRIPRQMTNMNDTMKEMMEFFEKQIAKPIGGLQVNDMLETIRTTWQPALQKCVQLLTDRLSQFVSHYGIQANEREMMKNPQKSS